MSFKIVRTSKTKVTNLPSFKTERPRSGSDEKEFKKEEVALEESSVGDAFEELFGESGQEVKPEEQNVPKRHVRKDDESDDEPSEEEPPKREYGGQQINENVNPAKASEVESGDLDDLISAAMADVPDEGQKPEQAKHSTSTPSKDGENDADFGDFISMIRDESEPPPPVEKKKDDEQPRDRRSGAYDDSSTTRYSSGKPSLGRTTTTTSYSFSSKFVPTIPASFYKNIQAKLEDLIFKFECLDNEYAALQKISHKVYLETMDIKKIFSNED